MSDLVIGRTKALEDVAQQLRCCRRRNVPGYSTLDAWRDILATRQRDFPDTLGTELESIYRLDLDICDRRIQALEGFRQDGVKERYE